MFGVYVTMFLFVDILKQKFLLTFNVIRNFSVTAFSFYMWVFEILWLSLLDLTHTVDNYTSECTRFMTLHDGCLGNENKTKTSKN